MPATIARLFDQIVPSNKDLLRVCRIFQHELDQALQFQAPDSLQVYPTFVHRLPNGSERGKYLALDLGGTNFRILLITLTGKHESQVSNKVFAISQELMHGPGGELFEYIAKCLHDFCLEADIIDERLPLGFTFSFPCKQAGLRKAYLTSWTKGFKCADTVNHDVCDMLQSALDKYPRLKIDVAAILNDTTGTLTSCAYMDSRCRVGVIIGTGFNLCYMESNRDMLNDGSPMIINTELGALGSRNGCLDHVRTKWDEQIDRASINAGGQLFEKMISGMYMGEIVRTIAADCINTGLLFAGQPYHAASDKFGVTNNFLSSYVSRVELDDEESAGFGNTRAVLSEMGIEGASDEDCRRLFSICSAVSRRSAYLVSAAIATILHRLDRRFTVVGIDGSVFRHHPHYQSMMYAKIEELLRLLSAADQQQQQHSKQRNFQLMLSEDGSGRGAALVAAVANIESNEANYGLCQHCSQPDCFPSATSRQCVLVKQ